MKIRLNNFQRQLCKIIKELSQKHEIECHSLPTVSEFISHCCQRKTFKGWDYNLYAMALAENIITIQKTISDFCTKHKIKNHTYLKTLKELKKQPVMYF